MCGSLWTFEHTQFFNKNNIIIIILQPVILRSIIYLTKFNNNIAFIGTIFNNIINNIYAPIWIITLSENTNNLTALMYHDIWHVPLYCLVWICLVKNIDLFPPCLDFVPGQQGEKDILILKSPYSIWIQHVTFSHVHFVLQSLLQFRKAHDFHNICNRIDKKFLINFNNNSNYHCCSVSLMNHLTTPDTVQSNPNK